MSTTRLVAITSFWYISRVAPSLFKEKILAIWRHFNPNLIVFSYQVLCSILDSNTKGTVDRTSRSLVYLLNFLLDF